MDLISAFQFGARSSSGAVGYPWGCGFKGLRSCPMTALKKSKCQVIRFFEVTLYKSARLGTIQGVRKNVGVRAGLNARATG